MKLCGLYFRFPCDDFDDLYWDDDYEDGKSFETWIRHKYTGPYWYNGQCEQYHFANATEESVIDQNPTIRESMSFEKWEKLRQQGKDPKKEQDRYKPINKASVCESIVLDLSDWKHVISRSSFSKFSRNVAYYRYCSFMHRGFNI